MKLTIDYLEEGEEPTIRIDTDSAEAIGALRRLFQKLASGNLNEAILEDIEDLQVEGSVSLRLQRSTAKKEKRKTVQSTGVGKSLAFVWTLTAEGWDDCVWWLQGMIQATEPCHQYLTQGPDDDAVIVIGFREI